jgi:hypothetical protein
VTVSRPLLLAVLLYVTLDLSSPAMPGAFVFEAGDSVETVARGRAVTTTILPAPVPVPDPRAVALSRLEDEPRPPSDRVGPSPVTSRRRPPRIPLESPPASEDPH